MKRHPLYGAYGLKLEIKANLSVVVYLDITLDLNTGLHSPFTKPNDVKNYVHKMSNHRPAVIKNIPKNINDRLCRLSSNEEINSTIFRQIPSTAEKIEPEPGNAHISIPLSVKMSKLI